MLQQPLAWPLIVGQFADSPVWGPPRRCRICHDYGFYTHETYCPRAPTTATGSQAAPGSSVIVSDSPVPTRAVFQFIFEFAGRYPCHCEVHGTLVVPGVIIVSPRRC